MHRVTRQERDYFEARVHHWCRRLSLGDWKVEVMLDDLKDNSAEVELWHNAHGAHVKLRNEFPYKPDRPWLDRLALHEVCHIMLCDLKRLINERTTTDAQSETAEHAVIRRLENLLCPAP